MFRESTESCAVPKLARVNQTIFHSKRTTRCSEYGDFWLADKKQPLTDTFMYSTKQTSLTDQVYLENVLYYDEQTNLRENDLCSVQQKEAG